MTSDFVIELLQAGIYAARIFELLKADECTSREAGIAEVRGQTGGGWSSSKLPVGM